ncbi:MAG: Sigma-70, region 4 [Chthoniobacter sp.]|jgi:RNA polymerase sigma factor (sigma-70 family)|nr:Sigma-70, region 4 [Chthoniobacter sp.]
MNSPEPTPAIETAPSLAALRDPTPETSRDAWERAYPLLWKAAMVVLHYRLAGPEHTHDREDIAARALAELVRGVIDNQLPSFNQMATFADVLGMTQQIVRARTKDFFRSRERRPEELADEVPDAPVMESSSALTWDECDALIRGLPPPQPEIFELHYAQGHTADEISARLGMPRGTVLSHLFRGKKTLRKKLEERAATHAAREGKPSLSL